MASILKPYLFFLIHIRFASFILAAPDKAGQIISDGESYYAKPQIETTFLGEWVVDNPNAGVAAMQLQLMPNDKVIWFDTTALGPSALKLKTEGNCPLNPDKDNQPDYFAHAVAYDWKTLRVMHGAHREICGRMTLLTKSMFLLLGDGKVIAEFPELPGRSRNYPPSGISALFPLKLTPDNQSINAEIVVCGGNAPNAYEVVDAKHANEKQFLPALNDCNRIQPLKPNPVWEKEQDMPSSRTMGDLLLLPTGDLLMHNGAQKGCSALLPDTKVLVAGSNMHAQYTFDGDYPTELRVEKFSPPYLNSALDKDRPEINEQGTYKVLKYERQFKVSVKFDKKLEFGDVMVTMLYPSFTTHGFSQNQRLLIPALTGVDNNVIIDVAPANGIIAPPGYYILFVNYLGIPGKGIWVHID
ncbi:hypothetical protein CTI12_AA153070 [Artemisia annua]|uniref:Galactose oxidase/kelch, beta-propeller n=1 Tax=Artemisia annua TaxID=35608 RepID=A0A2U1PFP9_ARTAN|nr:hypothetical protein CTI12_AA153070 [Artemisia annua]